MNYHPLVSVITPTYNHEKFIAQCIESVLAQTYPNWEQIIIDDGSTDRTGEIATQYKDERIKYIRQDNVGIWNLSKTYNRALDMAKGELIAVLEGDDFWPPYKLDREVPPFERPDTVLAWGKVAFANVEGKVISVFPRKLKGPKKDQRGQILKRLLFGNFIWPCTAMCRKSALLSIGGFKQAEYTPLVDYPTWLELSLIGNFSAVDEMLGYWRFHEGQVTSTMLTRMAEAEKYSLDFFERIPKELVDSLGVSIDQVRRNQQIRMASVDFSLGRMALIKGKWNDAKNDFKKVLVKGNVRLKIRVGSMIGLACSYLRVDLEWIVGLTGNPRFR